MKSIKREYDRNETIRQTTQDGSFLMTLARYDQQLKLIEALHRGLEMAAVKISFHASHAKSAQSSQQQIETEIKTAEDWIDSKILYSRGDYCGQYAYFMHCMTPQGQVVCIDTFTSDRRI